MIQTYTVSGMHCQKCVEKVTSALTGVPKVNNATVTLNPPEARIETSSQVPVSELSEAVNEAGNYSLKEKEEDTASASPTDSAVQSQSLTPLFIIMGYIVGGVVLRAFNSGHWSLHIIMQNFMGGFFVIFSLFKMINLTGFADAYSTYDLLASRSRTYALTYPFIELTLGCMYLTGLAPFLTNVCTALIMTISAVGVAQALSKKREIQCACLGTALKLPMTKVTLAEDLLMGVMAFAMLLGFD